MKLRIINDKRFSSGSWRVVDEKDEPIMVPTVIEKDHGSIAVLMPFCENTKEALIKRLLHVLCLQRDVIRNHNEQRKLAAPGQGEGTNSRS